MPLLSADDHQEKDKLKEQTSASRKRAAERQLKNGAAVIARGSEYLICEEKGSRTVLVWTDRILYPKLAFKDATEDELEGSPRFQVFRESMIRLGFCTILKNRFGNLGSQEERTVAHQLRQQYPEGALFFAKSDEAHTGLLDAIAAAKADLGNAGPSQQPRDQRKQAKARFSKKTNKRSEESEEELETSEAEDTEESDNNEESKGDDMSVDSDVNVVAGDEEEVEDEAEEGEYASGSIQQPSKQASKRLREASLTEEDPSPPQKRSRARNKTNMLGRELRLLETRWPNRSRLQEAGIAVDRQANDIIEQADAAKKAIQERNRLKREQVVFNAKADADIKKIEADRKAYNGLALPQIAAHDKTVDAFVNANGTAMQRLKQIVGKIVARGTTLLGVPR